LSERLKTFLVFEPGKAFRACLKVQPEWTLDRNLTEAELRGREDTADDEFFFLAVLFDLARLAIPEIGEDTDDLPRLSKRDLPALIAKAPAHLHPERGRVDQLHLALARRRLAVGDEPHVGRDPGVVEELLGQCDQRFEQVILQNESADLALAADGIAGEQRRAVHDDRDARAAFPGVLRVREHVQQEEQLAIADSR
jgi:hypothetical protein